MSPADGPRPNHSPDHAPAQPWDAERYAREFRFVAEYGRSLIGLLDPRPGERVLDLGCGDGSLTVDLAGTGLDVVAVDADPSMVAMARARGLDAYAVNGHELPYEEEFDAVFSNAALHWMKDADAVIAGVARALRPGGRFVAEMGGAGNVEVPRRALIAALETRGLDGAGADPWFFPTPEDYALRLERAGFRIEAMTHFPRPSHLESGLRPWLETFGGPFLNRLAADAVPAALAEVEAACAPLLRRADGSWWADYVRLRFRAVRA